MTQLYYETIMIFETETREVLVNAVPPREHSSNKTGNESLEANGIVVVQRRRMQRYVGGHDVVVCSALIRRLSPVGNMSNGGKYLQVHIITPGRYVATILDSMYVHIISMRKMDTVFGWSTKSAKY